MHSNRYRALRPVFFLSALLYICALLLSVYLLWVCKPGWLSENLTGMGVDPLVFKPFYYCFLLCVLPVNAIACRLFFLQAGEGAGRKWIDLSWVFMSIGVLIPWKPQDSLPFFNGADWHLLLCGGAFFIQLFLFIQGAANPAGTKLCRQGSLAALAVCALAALLMAYGQCVNLACELLYALALPPVLFCFVLKSQASR